MLSICCNLLDNKFISVTFYRSECPLQFTQTNELTFYLEALKPTLMQTFTVAKRRIAHMLTLISFQLMLAFTDTKSDVKRQHELHQQFIASQNPDATEKI